MRILVTGAAGFVGSHVAEHLLCAGHDVVGIDNFNSYYDPASKRANIEPARNAGLQLFEIDLATDNLTEAVRDIDAVFHLAAQPGINRTTSFEDYERNNVVATHRLVDACEKQHVQRALTLFANIATSSIYGADATGPETIVPAPTSHYGVTKLAAEQLVLAAHRERGLPACSLRLFSVYGPRERPEKLFPALIRSIASGTSFPLFDGALQHTRTFTYVGDAVKGLISALDHADKAIGEIFNIGSDNETSTERGIRIIEEITGRKAIFEHLPKRPGDQLRTHADITKARNILGYKPSTTPEDGLRETVKFFAPQLVSCDAAAS
ncbi:MAG: NAD-dependent epimerase/dehydratase family protein [Phycisphaeraceae bacterium]|nr:NAD-dependent epimerase/dehydratase family protein [Phycisphaerales bacterium]MCB9859454.1 NAD-dependent epimerase/dehydratase family protein [Phycisphaeraceae bacterium]